MEPLLTAPTRIAEVSCRDGSGKASTGGRNITDCSGFDIGGRMELGDECGRMPFNVVDGRILLESAFMPKFSIEGRMCIEV